MEVVLLENIKNLGSVGDVVTVQRGHARNFLIKYGKALKASKMNIEEVNKKKAKLNEKDIELKKIAKKNHELLNKKKYTFEKLSKDNNELYGSIKPKEISSTINNIEKIVISPSQIDLGAEISKTGTYTAKINLHAEVQATIHIEVVKQEEKK